MRKLMVVALAAWCVSSLTAAETKGWGKIDWATAQTVRAGVQLTHREYETPRLMKAYFMRVDLKTPGLHFTGMHRDPNWGRPMPDQSNGTIRVRRMTTVHFALEERAAGRDLAVAFNANGWTPWCAPWTQHYGDPNALCITEGVVVCDKLRARNDLFVAWADGTCEIRDGIPSNRWNQAEACYCGFEIILKNGTSLIAPTRKEQLHPRTAYGLSADGRYFFALVVDGRQPGWSLGAEYRDLVRMMLDAGAATAINMDGGGSSTMIYWDGARYVPVNRHDPAQRHWRENGGNMGIWFE